MADQQNNPDHTQDQQHLKVEDNNPMEDETTNSQIILPNITDSEFSHAHQDG